jgi:DNA repair exonuclease SbcCD ATPase subunit
MHLAKLTLTNWLRYEGEQTLTFKPTVYGIVARATSDEGRSNWLGKTSILRAIRFVLFGDHGAPTEDEWITSGEAEGSVCGTLSNGMVIERTRKLGKTTQVELRWKTTEGVEKANGVEAQRTINSVLGLTGKDFVATSYFEQKQISRYVSDRPGDRMETIAGWLSLKPLQSAAKRVAVNLAAIEKEEAKSVGAVQAIDTRVTEILAHFFDDFDDVVAEDAMAELDAVAADLRKAANDKKAIVERVDKDRTELEQWRRQADASKRRDGLLDEVDALDAQVDKAKLKTLGTQIAGCRKSLDSMSGDIRAAKDDHETKSTLARGKFDGKCPLDGHACPDTALMNAERDEHRKAAEQACVHLETIRARKGQVDEQADKLIAEKHRLEKLASQATKLAEAAEHPDMVIAAERISRDGQPPTGEDFVEEKKQVTEAAMNAESLARDAERYASELRLVFQRREQALNEQIEHTRCAQAHREAIAILGRNGAQRRIAEGALAEIDDGANALLVEAGIDLSVRQTWRHPTKGLGDTCEKCGWPFPPSAKVKACEKCDTPRPPKYIERPEIRLSSVSGAAEDVAGVAIQLSAASWLRAKRGTSWATVCIDEPFGSLDTTHRRALAVHLATMIKSQGFEQAFIVSHSGDVNDALPAIVQVTGDDKRSRAAVV